MSGTSRSFISMTAIGLRVAATPVYYPAHSKNGVNVDQRIVVRAIANIPSAANGGKGRQVGLNLVAWGKLADVLARSMSPGKEFHCELEPHVYQGPVFVQDASNPSGPRRKIQIQTPAGLVDVTTEKTSYRITRIVLGADSDKQIAREIEELKCRPIGWNIPGTPAYEQWRAELNRRNSEQYVPGSKQFGQAVVRMVEGPGIGPYDPTKGRTAVVNTAQAVAAAVAAVPMAAPAMAASNAPLVAGL